MSKAKANSRRVSKKRSKQNVNEEEKKISADNPYGCVLSTSAYFYPKAGNNGINDKNSLRLL